MWERIDVRTRNVQVQDGIFLQDVVDQAARVSVKHKDLPLSHTRLDRLAWRWADGDGTNVPVCNLANCAQYYCNTG